MGFLEVDSVTRAFEVFLPVRRDKRLGLRPVVVVGAVVVRVRAMMNSVCCFCFRGVCLLFSRWSCEAEEKKHEAQYLTLYLLLVLSARRAPMTADVGLDVFVRYDHRRNLEDVRALACRSLVDMGRGKTSYMAKAGSCVDPLIRYAGSRVTSQDITGVSRDKYNQVYVQ
jgi:hypothetical protein